MSSITVHAPAKVNLFLKVVRKRKDGFHALRTIFERIGLSDTIRITTASRGIVVTSDRCIVRDQRDNLVYKAACAVVSCRNIKTGLRIHIRKRIPIGAGLGGGSSDAAAVLIGVNTLLHLGISKKDLMRIGRSLGSDIGFFLAGHRFALGTGKGDRISPIDIRASLWHLLVFPGFRLPTKDVYRDFDVSTTRLSAARSREPREGDFGLTEGSGNVTIKKLREHLGSGSRDINTLLYNDLQRVVVVKKRVTGTIIERLASSCGRKAIISGSGPSVFCLFKTRKEAVAARRSFVRQVSARDSKRWQVYVVQTT